MSFLTGTNTELIYANTTIGTAKPSFTSEFQINDTAGMGVQASLPPYFYLTNPSTVGKTVRVVARGILSTTGVCTWQLACRLGAAGTSAAIVLGAPAGLSSISGAANAGWEFEGDFTLLTPKSAGANTSAIGSGTVSGAAFTTNGSIFAGASATTASVATIDTSITNFFSFTAVCGTNSASNTITLQQLLIFGLN